MMADFARKCLNAVLLGMVLESHFVILSFEDIEY